MNLFVLFGVIGLSSLVLTMIGLGGGLVFSPLFVVLGFPKSMAVAASLFLNGIAAASASLVYVRKKMVDFPVALPIIIASSLGAPLGALTTHRVDTGIFMVVLMLVVLAAALRMIFSSKGEPKGPEASRSVKIFGGGAIGLVIGFLGGHVGDRGRCFCGAAAHLFHRHFHPDRGGVFRLYRLFFLPDRIYHPCRHQQYRLALYSLGRAFSFAGGQIGSRIMAEKLRGRTIRIVFGVVLLCFFFKLMQRTFF